jgi:uncharacterized membrane protein
MPSAGMRQCIRDVSIYLVYLIFISTLGPLQFGFHLVRPLPPLLLLANTLSPN